MKHFPAMRHARFAGLQVEHTRAPRATLCSGNKALLCALFYAAGFITGAILFGELLLAITKS